MAAAPLRRAGRPLVSAPLRRAVAGLLALGCFAAALTLATRAKAQDVSPLAFLRGAAPALVETGRHVRVQLPPPPPFVRGRLVCAVNVNRYLARLGKPTTGSAAAASFLALPRRADRYTPGAVQISRRKGGHHAEVVAGGGLCWNPSARGQRWALVSCYARRSVIAWRAA